MDEYVKIIRQRMRIKSETLDSEIESYINAALLDMKRAGADVNESDLANPLVLTCTEFYCKWLLNFEAEGEKYETAYEKVRDSIALSRKESYEDKQ